MFCTVWPIEDPAGWQKSLSIAILVAHIFMLAMIKNHSCVCNFKYLCVVYCCMIDLSCCHFLGPIFYEKSSWFL